MSESSEAERWGAGRTIGVLALGLVPAAAVAWALGAWAPLPRMDRALLAGLGLLPLWSLAVLLLGAGVIARRRRRATKATVETASRARALGGRTLLFRLHLALGGLLAPLAFLLCFSGAVAVAARTLAAWEHAPIQVTAGGAAAGERPPPGEQPLDAIVDEVLREDPEAARGLLRIAPATEEQPWVQVERRGLDGSQRVQAFDPRTGAALAEGRGPLAVMVELHRNLLVPAFVGELLVASLGVLLVVVLACGLATRRRWSRELFRLRWRRLPQELHKLLGAWTLVFGVGAALTGAMMGGTPVTVPVMTASAYEGDQAALFRDVLAVERVPFDAAERPRASLTAVLEPRCFAEAPGRERWQVERITLQHPGYASARTTVEYEGPGPWLDRGLAVYDADGRALRCRALRQQSGGLQAFYATIALHFGEFGGAALGGLAQRLVEVLWILFGLALALGALLGEQVRQRRLEHVGRSPGRWGRGALVGLGLGLPLATIALLLLTRLAPQLGRDSTLAHGTFLAVWAGAWLWATLSRDGADPWRRAQPLAILCGLGLLLTALASVVVTEASAVDLLWACLGAAVLGGAWLRRRHRPSSGLGPQGDP